MVSACMAAKWLFGGKQRWRSDKGAAAHKMSKYKYGDGEPKLSMKNYKHKKENKAIVTLFVRVVTIIVISHDAGVGVDMISLTGILDLMTR